MSSLQHTDPSTVHPLPGKVLVRIDEVLGGTTEGGIFIPPDVADGKGAKDTASGVVIRLGAPPPLRHVPRAETGPEGWTRPGRTAINTSGRGWDPTVFPVHVGDRVYFPRDVPLVFVHDETRYALVLMDECILATGASDNVKIQNSQGR